MESLQTGDWVRFWTENWPQDVHLIRFSTGQSGGKNVTGQGLYMGRGKIIQAGPDGWLVREEQSDRLVRVSPSERMEPLKVETSTLTLGDLRRFLEKHRDAPDDIPILVSLPVGFNCDEDGLDLPEDHPEAHDADSYHTVSACNVLFIGTEENFDSTTDEYIAPENQKSGEVWFFGIEFIPDPEEAHEALRGCEA